MAKTEYGKNRQQQHYRLLHCLEPLTSLATIKKANSRQSPKIVAIECRQRRKCAQLHLRTHKAYKHAHTPTLELSRFQTLPSTRYISNSNFIISLLLPGATNLLMMYSYICMYIFKF